MVKSTTISFDLVFGRKLLVVVLMSFFLVSILLSLFFIHIEAFETLYDISRRHEEWEFDEIILIAISALFALSVSALSAAFILGRRLLVVVSQQIEHERIMAHGRKLQSMGSLLGGLSHSLNNHLVPILTISRMVREELPEGSEAYEDMSRVIQAAESSRTMLRQVLNFARHEENDLSERCVVDETVSQALDLARAAIPSSVSLHREIPVLPVTVCLSRLDLEIILLNLITNAVDAIYEIDSSKTGYIHVSLHGLDAENQPDNQSPTMVCLKVKDNGTGLTEEQKLRMFDPFYTTKQAGKGSGLGLSESYGIISKSGGTIEVDSTPGEFTEIRLMIPVVEAGEK